MKDIDGGLEKLAHLAEWKNSNVFSPAERVALEFADRMTITDQLVDDELIVSLKQHFSEAQIVELAAAIAFENLRSKFNPAFGIQSQGLCVMPHQSAANSIGSGR